MTITEKNAGGGSTFATLRRYWMRLGIRSRSGFKSMFEKSPSRSLAENNTEATLTCHQKSVDLFVWHWSKLELEDPLLSTASWDTDFHSYRHSVTLFSYGNDELEKGWSYAVLGKVTHWCKNRCFSYSSSHKSKCYAFVQNFYLLKHLRGGFSITIPVVLLEV